MLICFASNAEDSVASSSKWNKLKKKHPPYRENRFHGFQEHRFHAYCLFALTDRYGISFCAASVCVCVRCLRMHVTTCAEPEV